jgi:hypothetical protein
VHDARGKQVKHERFIANLDGMSGVVAALVSHHDVKTLGEQVDDLAFAFIAPLGADYCDNHRIDSWTH